MTLNGLLKNKEIILASLSPRRRELLSGMDIPYTLAAPYEAEEVYPDDLAAQQVPLYLSELKSDVYPYELTEEQILITADTVVILGREVIGKPSGRVEAVETLQKLSENTHTVITGVTLRGKNRRKSFSSESQVTFRRLAPQDIDYYVDRYQPYDKAGAYGIQEWIGYIGIERIEGSFYNVMGLPTRRLYTELIEFLNESL